MCDGSGKCGYHYFATASTYTGNLGGISGANTKCNSDSNGVSGLTYKAILPKCKSTDNYDNCSVWSTAGSYWVNKDNIVGYLNDFLSPSYYTRGNQETQNCLKFTSSSSSERSGRDWNYQIGRTALNMGGSTCSDKLPIMCAQTEGVDDTYIKLESCFRVKERIENLTVREGDVVDKKFPSGETAYHVDGSWDRDVVTPYGERAYIRECTSNAVCSISSGSGSDCQVDTNYTLVKIDNPHCQSNNVDCPDGCWYSEDMDVTSSNDQCFDKDGGLDKWQRRQRKNCYRTEEVTRCEGDSCKTTTSDTINGTMQSDGTCKKNTSSSGGTSGCFIAGTSVTMADGSTKNIENVDFGDLLMGSEGANRVKTIYKLDYEGWIYGINGSDAFATETHPFLTTEGWKSFAPLQTMKETAGLDVTLLEIGDEIITAEGTVVLESVGREWTETKVYNFDVTNSHDFYADGYLVHNVAFLSPTLLANFDIMQEAAKSINDNMTE